MKRSVSELTCNPPEIIKKPYFRWNWSYLLHIRSEINGDTRVNCIPCLPEPSDQNAPNPVENGRFNNALSFVVMTSLPDFLYRREAFVLLNLWSKCWSVVKNLWSCQSYFSVPELTCFLYKKFDRKYSYEFNQYRGTRWRKKNSMLIPTDAL